MKRVLIFCLILAAANSMLGERPLKPLPAWETEWEKAVHRDTPVLQRPMSPPAGTVVSPAEFAEMKGFLISWCTLDYYMEDIYLSFVENIAAPNTLFTAVNDLVELSDIQDIILHAGLSLDGINFIVLETESCWMRDYGPYFVYIDGELGIIDLEYYPERPLGDAFPTSLGRMFDMSYFEMPLSWEGGNFMSDGMGLCFTSDRILTDNSSYTESQIAAMMGEYFGCTRYYSMEEMLYDGTGHIDMYSKLIDPHRIIVSETDADGDDVILDRIAAAFDAIETSDGTTTLEVYRIPLRRTFDWWSFSYVYYTYTNSLIVDNQVFVPVYDIPEDAEAIAVYETLLPDHEIVQVDCSSIIDLGGAVHCITHEWPLSTPLDITDNRIILPELSISCSPNPFNPTTFLNIHTDQPGVTVRIIDMTGRTVSQSIEPVTAGLAEISVTLDESLPSGTYYASVTAGISTKAVKMVYLK